MLATGGARIARRAAVGDRPGTCVDVVRAELSSG